MDHSSTPMHPVLGCAETIDAALKDVADVDPTFMRTAEKQTALTTLTELADRVAELRLRVLASAGDVAEETGARDTAAWLAHASRLDRPATRRTARLADALDRRWQQVGAGVRAGSVNLDQAAVIVHALDDLPNGLDEEITLRAEAHLVDRASEFGPHGLRVLGKKVLEVIAPEIAEAHERRLLDDEERRAAKRTFLRSRRNGDGTTDLHIRVSDAVADRLTTYLEAFTSPRQTPADHRPYDQLLGHAFGAFLEAADPKRMPLHGGDATTVIVTIDFTALTDDLGAGFVDGDQPITADHARRLACTAGIIPAVLGGDSEILDLGRSRRLFSRAQRKAMAVRDRTCRAEGCEIPAAWCEAHHAAAPWSQGGNTDLADGLLLCSWHHHRAHDRRYDQRRLPSGDVRFARRT